MPNPWIAGIDDIFDIATPLGMVAEAEGYVLSFPPALIIARYLTGNFSSITIPTNLQDWPLYVGYMPDDTRRNAGAVYDTVGLLDGRIMRTGEVIEHPGIQIKVRSLGYETGYQKAREVVVYLDALINELVTIQQKNFMIKNASRSSMIASLGLDEKNNHNFTVNYTTTIKEV